MLFCNRVCWREDVKTTEGIAMRTVTLPIKGLNFAGCTPEIEKRLGKMHGIAHVEANYVSQTVTVHLREENGPLRCLCEHWLAFSPERERGGALFQLRKMAEA
jgi:cation transport ATPase